MVVGRIGTPATWAIFTAPGLNSLSSNDFDIVASGNTPTISPARSARTASEKAWPPRCRSTGMWCIPRMSGPATGWRKIDCLAMNRT